MNIILTGMRASGKTSLGKKLAKKLGWTFVDLDHKIEKRLNTKIDQYVKDNGWEAFRKAEKEVTQECANLDQTIISTGGGTMMDPENAKALKQNGLIVLLTCPLKILQKNLAASYERPSLTGEKSALQELEDIWNKRKAQYHAVADITHDTSYWPNLKQLLKKLKKIDHLNL